MPNGKASHTESSQRTFLTARSEFQNMFGDLAKGKRNWQLLAFGLLSVLTILLLAFLRLAMTSRITPYVVEVDRLGRAVAFGPAEPLTHTDRRIVIAQLATFVKNVRTVVPSIDAQRDILHRAYALVDHHGAAFLNTYFADPTKDPRVLGQTRTRIVEITSVLAVPSTTSSNTNEDPSHPETWKVQWTETEIPVSSGTGVQTTAWEGYLTVRQIPPTRTDVIEWNPLGLSISTITWSQIAATTPMPIITPPISPRSTTSPPSPGIAHP